MPWRREFLGRAKATSSMSTTARPKTTPELARARHLAERSATDLRLLSDATRAAKLPYAELSKVQRRAPLQTVKAIPTDGVVKSSHGH